MKIKRLLRVTLLDRVTNQIAQLLRAMAYGCPEVCTMDSMKEV